MTKRQTIVIRKSVSLNTIHSAAGMCTKHKTVAVITVPEQKQKSQTCVAIPFARYQPNLQRSETLCVNCVVWWACALHQVFTYAQHYTCSLI